MSQSRQSPKPPSSTSPSKSSLRSTGGPTTRPPPARGLGLLPSPSFDEVPRTGSPKTVGFDESTLAAADSIEQPPFQPFFTLVSDGHVAEHYHPTVHYVFANDEEGAEVISEGVLRSLQSLEQHTGKGRADARTTREHVLILDIDVKPAVAGEHAGYEVTQTQSLSADWQVSNVEVTNAPTMSEEDTDGGFMLKIEGRGPAVEDGRTHEMGRESLEDMLGRYQRGLDGIKRMVGPVAETPTHAG